MVSLFSVARRPPAAGTPARAAPRRLPWLRPRPPAVSPVGAAQQALLQQGRLRGSYYPGIWLNLLRGAVQHAAARERLRRRLGGIALGAGLGLPFTLLVWPLPLLLAPVVAVSLGLYLRERRRPPLSPRLAHCVIPLLESLRRELPPDQRLRLQLDLRGGTLPEKQVLHGLPYSHPPYDRVVRHNYLDHWMSGRATLADGMHLRWRASDQVSRFDLELQHWDGRPGNKVRYKQRTRLDLELRAAAGAFRLRPAPLRSGDHATRFRTATAGPWHRLHARRLLRHADAAADLPRPEQWSELLAELRGRLTPP
jgi:hypothetical protein